MMSKGKLLFLCALLFMPLFKLYGQSLQTQVDSLILKTFPKNDAPGAVFMIAHKGQAIYEKALGKANLELGVDMQMQQVFQLGSITKQFTAVAILILEDQGKLQVNDPVSKYIPDYPQGDKISLHHLLTHTSGIKDFTKMKALSQIAQKEMSPKMMVDFFKNEPVDFAPGEKFEYNNSGYVLLGHVIELVSGERYIDFIQKNIFNKVGMAHSYYATDRELIPHRAYGYHEKAHGYVNKSVINFSVPFASGALMSTAGDLLKWQNALKENRLLSAAAKEKAFRTYTLNDGTAFTYGYGWHIKQLNAALSYAHGGSVFGFKTMALYLPALDIYVLGMSNCDCHSPTQLTEAIATLAQQLLK